MLKKSRKLTRENSFLKIALVLISIILTVILKDYRIVLCQSALFLLFQFDYLLITNWLKILRKLIPFFLTYHLMAIMFSIEYPIQILFSSKLIYLSLLSDYLFTAFDIYSLLSHLERFRFRRSFLSSIKFIVLCNSFISEFVTVNRNLVMSLKTKSIASVLYTLSEAFSIVWNDKERIEIEVENQLNQSYTPLKQDILSNISVILLIIQSTLLTTHILFNYAKILSTISL